MDTRGPTGRILSRRVRRRAFLAGMAATFGAVAAAVGFLASRKWWRREAEEVSMATGGNFGEWTEVEGLPAFRYTLDQRRDPRARYSIREGEESTLNWHHIGNDETAAIATNDGWVQLFDFSHGPRWMNLWEPERGRYAGGFGYVFEEGKILPTLFRDVDPAAATDRVFGTGYFDTRLETEGLEVQRRVFLPFGLSSSLLCRVTLRNLADRPRSLRHFEYWDVNPRWLAFGSTPEQRREAAEALHYEVEASERGVTAREVQTAAAAPLRESTPPRVPPEPGPTLFLLPLADTPTDGFDTDPARFFGSGGRPRPDAVARGSCTGSLGSGHPCLVLQSNVELPPRGERTLWFAYGYTYEELPAFPSDPAQLERQSLEAWRSWLPKVRVEGFPELGPELAWHAYYLRASSFFDAFFGRRTIPQGFWYLYGSGFNATARDSVQHALPLVYLEPDLARDVLLSVLGQADETGEIPYSITGFGIRWPFIWQPGDTDIWVLWLATEYVFATRDFDLLDEPLAYYPPGEGARAPVWDHLVQAYRHLVDVVGVGARGLLRARNADWNDGLVFEAALDDPGRFIAEGESTLAAAFAAWVLPGFAALARSRGEGTLAEEVDAFVAGQREKLRSLWTGRWLPRAILPDGDLYGTGRLHLEPQPWAILAGVTDEGQTNTLLDEIDVLLRDGSPLGARLISAGPEGTPSGEATQGGVWFSITHTLVWAATARRPDLAWDEFMRNTLGNHTSVYPDIWVGVWSGPDAYNSDWSPRPGWTWDIPAFNAFGQRWPIQNVHAHAQPLLSFLRLVGLEPTPEGLRIAPAIPAKDWSIDAPAFGLQYSEDSVAGRMHTLGDSIEISVRLPEGLAGRELRVTSTAANVGYERDGADVTLRLAGPANGRWEWRIERA